MNYDFNADFREVAKRLSTCPECGETGSIGKFTPLDQDGFGEVRGYNCTNAYHERFERESKNVSENN